MDEALRKRLDAIVALLAVIAFLLAGGGDFLAMLPFVGAVVGLLARVAFPDLQGLNFGPARDAR